MEKRDGFNIGDVIRVGTRHGVSLSYSGSVAKLIKIYSNYAEFIFLELPPNCYFNIGDLHRMEWEWLELDKNYVVTQILNDL